MSFLIGSAHDFSGRKSELVTCVAEVALGEREDLGGLYTEHEDRIWEDLVFIVVIKAAVAHQVLPSSVPLGSPHLGEAFEHVMVGDPDGVALNHNVEPFLPVVAAGRQNHVRVPTKVYGLLFGVGSAEVDGLVMPHGNDRRDMRATVSPDRREPKHLGCFEHAMRLLPSRGNGVRVAEARVDFRDWFVHQKLLSIVQ